MFKESMNNNSINSSLKIKIVEKEENEKIVNILDLNENHEEMKNNNQSPHCSSTSSISPVETIKSNISFDHHHPIVVPNFPKTSPPSESFHPFNSSPSVASSATNAIDQYRLQFCNYAMIERLRNQNAMNLQNLYQPFNNCGSRLAFSLFQNRMFQNEEPKPQHSYIGLIAMAILGAPEQKLVLSDIYQHILDNYPYFRSRGPGWRNSIRHNLSLNDCFIKSGRSANGKGHYWAVHPANIEDFKRGDFRRRKAQRKVRRHMGLEVDEDADSPSPPPLSLTPPHVLFPPQPYMFNFANERLLQNIPPIYTNSSPRKRQFDVASLLAPDNEYSVKRINLDREQQQQQQTAMQQHQQQQQEEEDIDVVANDDSSNVGGAKKSSHASITPNEFPINRYHIPFSLNMDPRLLNYYHHTAYHHMKLASTAAGGNADKNGGNEKFDGEDLTKIE